MEEGKPPGLRITATRFAHEVRHFASSEVGGRAKWMFAVLLVLLCAANGLVVTNSYVGRDFMTAIAERHKAEFVRQALFYLAVFAASTAVTVIARFLEERLGLMWRDNLTRRTVNLYLKGAYCNSAVSGALPNPDQRIAEDIRAFAVSTLSFFLMAFNSSLTIIAFSGVMLSISPVLTAATVLYAAFGSYVTFLLGRPLIKLNFDQLDKEASFRASLVHVRENSESIFLARREDALSARLLRQFDTLAANYRKIITTNRNVGFFTTGYNWMIQIIPILIIAPAYMAGAVEFGVITQSAAAFSTAVAAFSLVVTQFQSISSFAAVLARLSSMAEAFEGAQTASSTIQIVESEGPLAYDGLTLSSQTERVLLLENFSATIPFGSRVLVTGANTSAGIALFSATAGDWAVGKGRVVRPRGSRILFLAQKPYLPPGSLRQALTPAGGEDEISDNHIASLARELNLDHVLRQAGGLDADQSWGTLISLRDQQLLAFLHIFLSAPQVVFMDRLRATLAANEVRQILGMLTAASIGYVSNGETDDCRGLCDAVLDCKEGGKWTWTAAAS